MNHEQAQTVARRIRERRAAEPPVSAEKFNTLLADAKALAEFVLEREQANEARTA
jgi:hypothetical protein